MLRCVLVDIAKLLRPGAPLVSTNSYAGDVSALAANCLVNYPARFVHAEVPDGVEDPVERHAKVALAALTSSLRAFEQRSKFLPSPMNYAGRDVDLGMQNILRVQLLHHPIGHQFVVFGSAQPLSDRLER